MLTGPNILLQIVSMDGEAINLCTPIYAHNTWMLNTLIGSPKVSTHMAAHETQTA